MQREKGYHCKGSGVGFPHGKDKKRERAKRTQERLAEKAAEQAKAKEKQS